MIKAILIDDEMYCLDTLRMLLADYCPEVDVADAFLSAKKAQDAIAKIKPDLVFLDIEMPVMNGFEFLEHYTSIPFSVVFTTSYDQYAIKAIRFSALDYLLKPIDPKELVSAVRKIAVQKMPPSDEQFRMLADQFQNKKKAFTRVAVPTLEGFELIPVEEILFCEAENNYTLFFLKQNRKLVVSRTLKDIDEQLGDYLSFLRVHHSYIVNLNEVTKYIRGEGGYLVMSNGATVSVSRGRKDALLRFF
jgi:two-component system, LytTR family, response regulator